MTHGLTANSLFGRIIQGLKYRLEKLFTRSSEYEISPLKLKVLKHQTSNKLKRIKIGDHVFFYTNALEMLHCYEEILLGGIYKFTSAKTNPVIIDCGAHMGVSIAFFKDMYPQSTVIAFEPDSRNFELLEKNNKKKGNVILHKKAVWTYNGVISFSQTGDMASHISIGPENSPTAVECVRLRDYLASPVDFLKIDIEGAEYEVLKDCEDQLGNVSNLFLEYHGYVAKPFRLIEILNILKNAVFCIYIKEAADTLRHPFVTKIAKKGGYDVQLNIFCYRTSAE